MELTTERDDRTLEHTERADHHASQAKGCGPPVGPGLRRQALGPPRALLAYQGPHLRQELLMAYQDSNLRQELLITTSLLRQDVVYIV